MAEALKDRGMEAMWTGFLERYLPPENKEAVLANDAEALSACLLAGGHEPGYEDILSTMTMPCLIYAGEADPFYPGAKECGKQIPNTALVSFSNLDHMQALVRSDLVLPHMIKFLAEVSAAQAG